MTPDNQLNVREEVVKIPTYKMGQPEQNPMFLEKRVYQAAAVPFTRTPLSRAFLTRNTKRFSI